MSQQLTHKTLEILKLMGKGIFPIRKVVTANIYIIYICVTLFRLMQVTDLEIIHRHVVCLQAVA